jgi:hypothetical protein
MTRSGGPNFLGAKYAPFVVSDNPSSPDFRVRDLEASPELVGRLDRRGHVRPNLRIVELCTLRRRAGRRPGRLVRLAVEREREPQQRDGPHRCPA